jgi:hypothetical protein
MEPETQTLVIHLARYFAPMPLSVIHWQSDQFWSCDENHTFPDCLEDTISSAQTL